METVNTIYPPNNTNPLAADKSIPYSNTNRHIDNELTTADDSKQSTLHSVRSALHDMKENVKETLQRDHHHGQDCAKKPQDGKTNPME